MLTLFPQYRFGLGIGLLLTAAAAGLMINAGTAWYWPALTIVICGFSVLAIAELAAASRFQALLTILYRDGDPKRFIAAYEPLLRQRNSSPTRALTVRAYLSNAYLAIGDAETALRLLDESPEVTGREAANAQALLAGNRCSIYCQLGDSAQADAQLELLKQLQLEAADEKQDLYQAIPRLESQCALLHGRVVGMEEVKRQAEQAKSPTVKASLQLLEAQMQFQCQHYGTARAQLEHLSQGREEYWAVCQAKKLLETLPPEGKL